MTNGPFIGCINDAAAAGDIDPAVAEDARKTYQDAFDAVSDVFGPADADRAAAKAVMEDLDRKALQAQRQRAMAIRARRQVLADVAAFKRKRGYTDVHDLGLAGSRPPKEGWVQGGAPPKAGPFADGKAFADALIQLVDGDGGLAGGAGPSIKGRYQAIRGRLDAMMAGFMEKFETSTGFLLNPQRAALENIVREAFGQDTGDKAAKMFADAWAQTAETARQMFNAAGGAIAKLEGWGLPQTHDFYALMRAGKDAWTQAITPLLDRGKLIDHATNRPFTDARLKVFLGDTFETITSDGAIGAKLGENIRGGSLANQRQEARILPFKDADSWLAYQRQFGAADPYAAMMHHLDGMARDIAQLQVLGPNPDHQWGWLKKAALTEAKAEEALGAKNAGGLAQSAVDTAERMYGLFTGELAGPYGRYNRIAQVSGAIRGYLQAAQLGSAVITDGFSRPAISAQARAFTGLSKTGDFAAWRDWVLSPEARAVAHRTGFIQEHARAHLEAATRDTLRSVTVGGKLWNGVNSFSRRIPISVFRLSGFSGNLAASRWAFQHEFMGALADRVGQTLAELERGGAEDQALAGVMRARGITDAMWDQMRTAPLEEPVSGAKFLSPMTVGNHAGEEMGFRLAEMIERQTRMAVPEPGLWAQSHLIGHMRPATVMGELMRSLSAYRSFTVTTTHLWANEFAARAMEDPRWRLGSAMHAAPMIVGMTLGGLLANWVYDVVNGNDPRSARDPMTWAAALLKGGGAGIFGDFLYSATARNDKGGALTAMGAPAALVSDLSDMTAGAAFDTAKRTLHDHEDLDQALADQHEGRKAARFLAKYSPVSSMWWTRAVWDRMVTAGVQRLLDPDADTAFQRHAQSLQDATGQQQWWPEGQALPSRAPNLGAVLAEPVDHLHHRR
jgi:hypothetical protein